MNYRVQNSDQENFNYQQHYDEMNGGGRRGEHPHPQLHAQNQGREYAHIPPNRRHERMQDRHYGEYLQNQQHGRQNFEHKQHHTESSNSNSKNDIMSYFYQYIYPLLTFIFPVIFFFKCCCGSPSNDRAANLWYLANHKYFESNYEECGNKKDYMINIKNNTGLIKENDFVYKYYATKKNYIYWTLVTLNFQNDRDSVFKYIFSYNDKIVIECSLNTLVVINTVFCLCKKKDVKQMKRDKREIDFFCKESEPSFVSDKYVLLAEENAIFLDLFENRNLLGYFRRIEEHIDYIYYSDRNENNNEYYMVCGFDISLAQSGIAQRLLEMSHFVHLLIDEFVLYKISHKQIKAAERARLEYNRFKNRIEETTPQKSDKKEKDKDKKKKK